MQITPATTMNNNVKYAFMLYRTRQTLLRNPLPIAPDENHVSLVTLQYTRVSFWLPIEN